LSSGTNPEKAAPSNASRLLMIGGVLLILMAIGFCGYKVHTLSIRQEQIKTDYTLINSVSFGLLSVDEWRDDIISAVSTQIQQFKLTAEQEAELKKEIEQILHALVEKAISSMQKPKKSIGGKIEKLAFNSLVSGKKLHEEVPGFADKIMSEINKPSSMNRLKDIAKTKVNQLGIQTYDSSKTAENSFIDSIFRIYNVSDKPSFEKQTANDLMVIRKVTYEYATGMLGGIMLILLLWWVIRNKQELHASLYSLSIISALLLLVVGLTSTMVQIDARIQSMDFHLLGQSISFKNQVLFFQSKSIVDVVALLIKTGKLDSVIVGILILIFSIIFPVTKLLSTGIYMIGKENWAKNKIVHYFAFESGKWSMADVMVVAILMTFIGFNGIVNSTLSGLNLNNGTITSITTNNTSIQPGYIIFIGFVLYGFVLSAILKRVTAKK
jgi:Paraquat-inducible protein A